MNAFLKMTAIGALTGLAGAGLTTAAEPGDPTRGWTRIPLEYKIQKPFDLQLKDRYQFDPVAKTHRFWVYFTDKPHQPPPNKTTARTEMRMENFKTGERMFDADVHVVEGTNACIAQVFDAKHGPVTMIIARPDGTVAVGNRDVIKTHAIGKWWNLKMTNDTAIDGRIRIYVDNVLMGTYPSRGPGEYYFKCGVYSRKDSGRSEAKFRNITMWKKAAGAEKSVTDEK